MDKPDTKQLRETLFVSALARAIAVANGHSHPDAWAESVVGAYSTAEETSDTTRSIEEARAEAKASREG